MLLLTFSRRAAAAEMMRAGGSHRGLRAAPSKPRLWRSRWHGRARFMQSAGAAVAGIRAAHRSRSRLHHPRSRRLRRPHEPPPPRSRFLQDQASASRPKAPASPSTARAVNAQAPLDEVLGSFFPWCAMWEAELRALFAAYVEAKQHQCVLDYDDLPALLVAHDDRAGDRGRRRRPFRSCAGRRISGHQPACRPRFCWPSSRPATASPWSATMRNRSIFVSGRDRAEHSGLPGALSAARRDHHARAQLSLHVSRSSRPQMP